MPRNAADIYAAEADPNAPRNAADIYSDGPVTAAQPDTTSADKVRTQGTLRRFLSAGWQATAGGALDAAGKVATAAWQNPLLHKADPLIEMGKSVMGVDYAKKAWEAVQSGRYGDALRYSTQANPAGAFIAHGYEGIGEKIGEGDVAGAAGDVTGNVANVAAMGGALGEGGALEGPANAVKNAGTGLARRIYQKVNLPNRWFRKLPQNEQNLALDKGLDNWVKPTAGGTMKAEGRVSSGSDQIEDIAMVNHPDDRLAAGDLDTSAQLNDSYKYNMQSPIRRKLWNINTNYRRLKFETADPQEIADARAQIASDATQKARAEYASQVFQGKTPSYPKDILPEDIPDSVVKATAYPSTMSVKDMMILKRTIRQSVDPAVRNGAVDAMAGHIAKTANDTIIGAFPELKELGQDTRDWIRVRDMVKEASGKAANRSMTGLAGAMTPMAIAVKGVEGATTAGQAALIGSVMRWPALQATLASMVYKASQGAVPLSSFMARMGAMTATLDNMEDKDQREAAAHPAGQ